MMRILITVLAFGVLGFAGLGAQHFLSPALAQTQEQTTSPAGVRIQVFAVDKMTCAACPITVRTAITNIGGVRSVAIDFDARTATVTFDPTMTTLAAIADASAGAGYPARPIGG